MKTIELTQGQVALVDDDDYEWLNQWKWCAHWQGLRWYAVRRAPTIDGKQYKIRMHRVVIDAQPGQQVDHKDRDGLNNRRDNLRLCTNSQNQANRGKQAGCSSKFKGVTWHKQTGKWQARIRVHRKGIYLGVFDDEVEAGRAYDDAAIEHFGEFARLNVIERKGN